MKRMNANMRQDLTCLSHTLQVIETYYYKDRYRERVISQIFGVDKFILSRLYTILLTEQVEKER